MSSETPTLAEAALECAADAVIYADDTGRIRCWNGAAARLFGYAPAEAIGRSLDLIIPEYLRSSHWQGFDAAMISGATKLSGRPMLTRTFDRSGRKLYVEMSFALVPGQPGGEARGAVAVARDVTATVEQQRADSHRSQPG